MGRSISYLAVLLSLTFATSSPPRQYVSGDQSSCCTLRAGFDPIHAANQAKRLSTHSWEYGTASEAFLELYNPDLSVFSSKAFPNAKIPVVNIDSVQSLSYAKPVMRTNNDTLIDGDGASGDPASLGVSALLVGQTSKTYFSAAVRQYNHFATVPRWPNGAISHRDAYAELWADFIYMAPPFFAYYAVATNNASILIDQAARQCLLYRQVLKPNVSAPAVPTAGTWQHIRGPVNQDLGIWSTGNAWAAMGMARVLATAMHWQPTASEHQTHTELFTAIGEIFKGAMRSPKDGASGLLRNYLNDTTWFGEISGTSLVTAAVYRIAVLQSELRYRSGARKGESFVQYVTAEMLNWADANRAAVAKHTNKDGIASPAVNPLGWGDRTPYTKGSPEGESFVVMLYAAWRDCVTARVCKQRY